MTILYVLLVLLIEMLVTTLYDLTIIHIYSVYNSGQ